MIYAGIDLDEDNPMLNEIIEHIEDDGDNVYTLYLYNKDFDYWEENIVKTILSSQPWFDFERYAEDMVEENIYDMDDDYEWIYVNGANYLVATMYR